MGKEKAVLPVAGVDIAGKNNTWIAWIHGSNELTVHKHYGTISELAETLKGVNACAIDAPLTYPIKTAERASDNALIEILEDQDRRIVMSPNSLMAVPLRGGFLQRKLEAYKIPVCEAHPRASACLLNMDRSDLQAYKGKKETPNRKRARWNLWDQLRKDYEILQQVQEVSYKKKERSIGPMTEKNIKDGMIDAILCALTAYYWKNKDSSIQLIELPGRKENSKRNDLNEESIGCTCPPFFVLSKKKDHDHVR